MPKNLFNPGDSVVMAQRYLIDVPESKLYGKQGIVYGIDGDNVTVMFSKDAIGPFKLKSTELEFYRQP